MSPPATYWSIVNALATEVKKATGIGAVHRRRVPLRMISDFNAAFYDSTTQTINGWTITRISMTDEQASNLENERRHKFALFGVMSVKTLVSGQTDENSSEVAFQTLLNAICETLRPQVNLGVCELIEPVQIESVDGAYFGEHLCHTAQLSVIVQEFYTPGS